MIKELRQVGETHVPAIELDAKRERSIELTMAGKKRPTVWFFGGDGDEMRSFSFPEIPGMTAKKFTIEETKEGWKLTAFYEGV